MEKLFPEDCHASIDEFIAIFLRMASILLKMLFTSVLQGDCDIDRLDRSKERSQASGKKKLG